VRPLQAAVWEIAALAAVLALTLDHVAQPVLITTLSVAAVLVAVTSVRVAGLHLAGWAAVWLGFRLRRHDDRRDSPDPLHRIAGAVRVRQHVDRAGNRFGVAEADGGWSAIIRLTGHASPRADALVPILRAAYERKDIPLSSAQLLVWTVSRGDGQPPLRAHWLTVRYTPAEAPIAALARGGGDLGALRSTACVALELMGALAESGYESTVLEAGELAEELRVALGAERQPSPEHEITDSWRSWSAGPVRQTCYAPLTDSPRILDAVVDGATFTAGSYTLCRTPGGKDQTDVTFRVGGDVGDAAFGVRAVPLHGRHAAAVRRTLPLALER
jgi:type VII secretion protein EccE